MKVQRIEVSKNKYRYLLIDDNFEVVDSVKRYLKYLDNIGRQHNTLKNYAHHLKIYFEYLERNEIKFNEIATGGNNPLEILGNYASWLENPGLIQEKISYIAPPEAIRKSSTINVMIDTVLGFYEFLSRGHEVPSLDVYQEQKMNPQFKKFLHELIPTSNKIRKNILHRKTQDKIVKAATREQYHKLIEGCIKTRDKAMVSLMFEGGLRLSEVLGLFIEDIEPYNNKVKIRARENLENGVSVKNKSEGDIYIPAYVMKYITDYIINELAETDTNFLFVNLSGPNKGRAMKEITVQKLFERLSAKIDEKIHPHMLRHGHATELIESGWDLSEVKERLRHRSLQSTTVYTHMSDEYKKQQIRKFHSEKGLSNEE